MSGVHRGTISVSTLQRTIRKGPVRNRGTERDYHALAYGDGEPRLLREDLWAAPSAAAPDAQSLLYFAHLTDAQIADVQSPGRLEFLERMRGEPGDLLFVPTQRPQELLASHALDAAVRAINTSRTSPDTGADLAVAVNTGDSLDNAQLNELAWFMTTLGGGVVDQASGSREYEGVQSPSWPDPTHWHPDPVVDRHKERWGFPARPGLLEEARKPFAAEGLRIAWLSCFGNHDGLIEGNASPTPMYERILRGDRKPEALPEGLDPVGSVEQFLGRPELYLQGPSRRVTADPRRRTVGRREFIRAHLDAAGEPAGHGFTEQHARDGTAYAAHDLDAGPVPLRLIVLDSTNMDGFSAGSIGGRQFRWLEEALLEVHSQFVDEEGRIRTQSAQDRIVLLFSHHGLDTMLNMRRQEGGLEEDQPRIAASDVERLVHRFPNVALWVTGHMHVNRVVPRPDPQGRTAGFWEVCTSSTIDWPCQVRLLELVRAGEQLSILSTMVDLPVPLAEDQEAGIDGLVALHRELAANNPFEGMDSWTAGTASDRNVALRLPMPFPA